MQGRCAEARRLCRTLEEYLAGRGPREPLRIDYLDSLGLPFINADRIAEELRSGSRVVPRHLSELSLGQAAQRIADEERLASVVLRRSFVTETVLSDPVGAKVAMLNDARGRGYEVWLFFIGIGSPELSRARVHERVSSRKGHDVPADKIEARYARTLANLPRTIEAASIAVLFDNDLAEAPYRSSRKNSQGRRLPVCGSSLFSSMAHSSGPPRCGPSGRRPSCVDAPRAVGQGDVGEVPGQVTSVFLSRSRLIA